MQVQLKRLAEDIRSSYWFLPAVMGAGGAALVGAVYWLEDLYDFSGIAALQWLYRIGPEGIRTVLSTVAGASIGTASVVFSVSIVALSLTSSQFGPRLLRNFLTQGISQAALGIFLAAFIFSLLALASVPSAPGEGEIGYLLVLGGLTLGLLSFAALIAFIQHTASFIQAPRVIADVTARLGQVIEALPQRQPDAAADDDDDQAALDDLEVLALRASASGYVQAIDQPQLLELASASDLRIRASVRPGHFLIDGEVFALAAPRSRLDEETARAIFATFLLGRERTPTQDIEFAIDQLVEIAVRALSPGINDPGTAINCIDQLGAALGGLARRQLPPARLRDEAGGVRVELQPFTYPGLLDAAFNQIRQNAARDVAVNLRLLETMNSLAQLDLPPSFAAALLAHARKVKDSAIAAAPAADQPQVSARYEAIERTFARNPTLVRPDAG